MVNSDLTLYHVPPSRSCRVLWLIHELDLPVNVQETNFLKDPSVIKTDEFKQINPLGKLPALTDKGGVVVNESGAAVLYLLEQYDNGRLQPSRSDAAARAQFLQFIFMAETELTSHLERYFWHTFQHPEEKRLPQVAQIGKDKALEAFDALEKILEGKEYLVNNEFSAADVATGYACQFLSLCKLDEEGTHFPNVKKYTERLAARPAFKKVFG
jgi:glutathione S-transferase